jgi:hypothetical protein
VFELIGSRGLGDPRSELHVPRELHRVQRVRHDGVDLLQPARAFAIIGNHRTRFDEDDAESAVCRDEEILAFAQRARAADALGQLREPKRIVAAPREVHGRERGGERLLRVAQEHGQVCVGKSVGQRGEDGRRLVEPRVGDQLGRLAGILQPQRLPGDLPREIRGRAQRLGDAARRVLRRLGIFCIQRDDQLAPVGEIRLVKFDPAHHRELVRQQVQHLDIQLQPPQSEAHRNEQQQPEPVA